MKKEWCIWLVMNLGLLRSDEGRKRKKMAGKGPKAVEGGLTGARTREAFMACIE